MAARSSILALILALSSAPSLAQGTRAQREACTPDVFRLCAAHVPNVSAITGCLRREAPRLSPACRTAMREAEPQQPPPALARPAPERAAPVRTAGRGAAPPPAVRIGAGRPVHAARVRAPVRLAAREVAAREAHARRAARHHRRYAGSGRFGGGSEMRQAAYWLGRLGGIQGLAGLAGGFEGGSLEAVREMRVGDLLDMMR